MVHLKIHVSDDAEKTQRSAMFGFRAGDSASFASAFGLSVHFSRICLAFVS